MSDKVQSKDFVFEIDKAKIGAERRYIPPLGSTFKLYVLAALAETIIASDLAWKDKLAIWEELKSLPSGTMQNKAAGTHFLLLEFAQLMIQ
jgi:beta-lactamase class A